MAMKLTNKDHKKLDALLKTILNAYKTDEVTQGAVIGAIAHVFTAAAIGNESEVRRGWTGPRWSKTGRTGPEGDKRRVHGRPKAQKDERSQRERFIQAARGSGVTKRAESSSAR